MIGTSLVEELVQSVCLSHLVKGHRRASLLLLAAPESGKTTIATSAESDHICRVAVMSGRSVLAELKSNPKTEFLLFNDLTVVRAMSTPAVNLLINLLNQVTQGETGKVAFAGKGEEKIEREVGIIGCLAHQTFVDHRARWKEMGFISRMIPFAYQYPDELVAEIKDAIDRGERASRQKKSKLPKRSVPVIVHMAPTFIRELRRISDARARQLAQLGIRLLQNYHSVVRAHALLNNRTEVTRDDLDFLRAVDRHVSIRECLPLERN